MHLQINQSHIYFWGLLQFEFSGSFFFFFASLVAFFLSNPSSMQIQYGGHRGSTICSLCANSKFSFWQALYHCLLLVCRDLRIIRPLLLSPWTVHSVGSRQQGLVSSALCRFSQPISPSCRPPHLSSALSYGALWVLWLLMWWTQPHKGDQTTDLELILWMHWHLHTTPSTTWKYWHTASLKDSCCSFCLWGSECRSQRCSLSR